jgi:hypothetical protein
VFQQIERTRRVWIVNLDDDAVLIATDVEYNPASLQNAGIAILLFDLRRIGPGCGPGFVKPGLQLGLRVGTSTGQFIQRSSLYNAHILPFDALKRKSSFPFWEQTCRAKWIRIAANSNFELRGKIVSGQQEHFDAGVVSWGLLAKALSLRRKASYSGAEQCCCSHAMS